MLLNTGKKEYRIIREVLRGELNDVYVCQNREESRAPYKTVWIVRDRRIAKELMGTLGDACEEYFMHNEAAGFVFPYDGERPLDRFYLNTVQTGDSLEARIWLEMVVRCMTSKLTSPVLNLILKQEQVHIGPDGTIWFGYFLDLSDYDAKAGEKENAALCAAYIVRLIELDDTGKGPVRNGQLKRLQMKRLLTKKMDRHKYQEFILLYGDVRMMLKEDGSGNKKERLKAYVTARQDLIYRLLSVLCAILLCIVLLMLAGYLVFGEFSLWRLFGGPLDKIGTEVLVR